MTRLYLNLFGGFEARLERGSPLTFRTQKAQALLAYLAVPPGQAHRRDKLAALLWGAMRDEQARTSLRQALYDLRKNLGSAAGVLRSEGETVWLDPAAVELDVTAFTRIAGEEAPEALEQAALLYRGDLLEGFRVDEEPFEAWLMQERERLRELALEALARGLSYQRKTGALAAALRTARQLLALDRLQEPVHRTLMRLHAQLGQRAAALRQYQQCVSVLQRELGVEPELETKQLYQEILRQRATASGLAAWPRRERHREAARAGGARHATRRNSAGRSRRAPGAGPRGASPGESWIGPAGRYPRGDGDRQEPYGRGTDRPRRAGQLEDPPRSCLRERPDPALRPVRRCIPRR